jgi:predicted metal-dependent hydrolase
VPGNPEFMARRVREWLKQQVLAEIMQCVEEKTPLLGKKPRKISLRDTSSRWGSCSSKGHLSFSWRMVLAPREVLHYLVCHELAHLAHMNHSAKFWKQVEMLCPDYRNAERWLKYHGNSLYRYG